MPRRRSRLLALPDAASIDAVERAAADAGLDVEQVGGLGDLLGALARGPFAATLVSGGADGVEPALLARIADHGEAGALILTHPSVSLEHALVAERVGATSTLPEPVDPDELARHLRTVVDEGPVVPLPEVPGEDPTPVPIMLGESPAMAEVFRLVARVAPSASTVLVTGESGTGKELVAQALHAASDRADEPFVAVNCAAIPEHLLESDLFGHERGAFTGAVARRIGRFERAGRGTLFLDEIGDMSAVLQAKILRVLEEGVVEPVGGDGPRPVHARVVAATHRDLRARVEEGRFREDLFFRLAVVEVALPPLRERGGDVEMLALHFAARFARRHGRELRGISRAALRRMAAYPWPGNVRELRNVLDRAVLLAPGDVVPLSALRLGEGAPRTSARAGPGAAAPGAYPDTMALADVERLHIARVLDAHGGQIGDAADVLGIHRNTLARKLRRYQGDGADGPAAGRGA